MGTHQSVHLDASVDDVRSLSRSEERLSHVSHAGRSPVSPESHINDFLGELFERLLAALGFTHRLLQPLWHVRSVVCRTLQEPPNRTFLLEDDRVQIFLERSNQQRGHPDVGVFGRDGRVAAKSRYRHVEVELAFLGYSGETEATAPGGGDTRTFIDEEGHRVGAIVLK